MSALEFTLSAAGQTAVLEVGASNSLMVSMRGGTVNATGLSLVFEGSMDSTNGVDGTWFPVSAGQASANTSATGWGSASSLNANTGVGSAWRANVANLSYFRVRASALTAGNIRVLLSTSPEAIDPVPVLSPVANPSPSGTSHKVVSAASTNLALVRGAASDINDVTVSNPTGTAAYVKLYDLNRAPTSTDVPEITIPLPAGGFVSQAFGYLGKRFANGIGIGITGAAAANDTTVAPAGVVVHLTRGA